MNSHLHLFLVSSNKERCKTLAGRADLFLDCIQTFQSNPTRYEGRQDLLKCLKLTKDLLGEVEVFMTSQAKTLSVSKFITASTDSEKISDLTMRLNTLSSQLSNIQNTYIAEVTERILLSSGRPTSGITKSENIQLKLQLERLDLGDQKKSAQITELSNQLDRLKTTKCNSPSATSKIQSLTAELQAAEMSQTSTNAPFTISTTLYAFGSAIFAMCVGRLMMTGLSFKMAVFVVLTPIFVLYVNFLTRRSNAEKIPEPLEDFILSPVEKKFLQTKKATEMEVLSAKQLEELRIAEEDLNAARAAALKNDENYKRKLADLQKQDDEERQRLDDFKAAEIRKLEVDSKVRVNQLAFEAKICSIQAANKTAEASAKEERRLWDLAIIKKNGADDHFSSKMSVLEGHHDRVSTAIVMSNGTICSGSVDNSVRLWNSTSMVKERVLKGHRETVTALVELKEDHRVCSGSDDATIKIWHASTGHLDSCERTLVGHKSGIASMLQLFDGRLCSGDLVGEIKIWDIKSRGFLHLGSLLVATMTGHDDAIKRLIQLNDLRICSAGGSNICIWALCGEKERTLSVGEPVISLIQLRSGRICSGSQKGEVKIWNLTHGNCELVIAAGNNVNCLIELRDGRICTASHENHVIKLWNATTGGYDRSFCGSSTEVVSLIQLNDDRICSGSFGRFVDGMAVITYGMIKVWNLSTGNCDITLEGHGPYGNSLFQLPDSRLFTYGTNNGIIKIWGSPNGLSCSVTGINCNPPPEAVLLPVPIGGATAAEEEELDGFC